MFTIEDVNGQTAIVVEALIRRLVEQELIAYDDQDFCYRLRTKCYLLGGFDYLKEKYGIEAKMPTED